MPGYILPVGITCQPKELFKPSEDGESLAVFNEKTFFIWMLFFY